MQITQPRTLIVLPANEFLSLIYLPFIEPISQAVFVRPQTVHYWAVVSWPTNEAPYHYHHISTQTFDCPGSSRSMAIRFAHNETTICYLSVQTATRRGQNRWNGTDAWKENGYLVENVGLRRTWMEHFFASIHLDISEATAQIPVSESLTDGSLLCFSSISESIWGRKWVTQRKEG